jgi:3-deoxy-D-manno-octulosonate 8-phosphate phosphatase (KDO 8-P phosphatase)
VPAIRWAGIGVTVPTAMPSPLAAAHYITTRPAGYGAVREICDLILLAQLLPPATSPKGGA